MYTCTYMYMYVHVHVHDCRYISFIGAAVIDTQACSQPLNYWELRNTAGSIFAFWAGRGGARLANVVFAGLGVRLTADAVTTD